MHNKVCKEKKIKTFKKWKKKSKRDSIESGQNVKSKSLNNLERMGGIKIMNRNGM